MYSSPVRIETGSRGRRAAEAGAAVDALVAAETGIFGKRKVLSYPIGVHIGD